MMVKIRRSYRQVKPAQRTRCRPRLEILEDRVTPSLTTGIFEIDGNAIDNTPGTGTGVSPALNPAPDDWANIFKSLGSTPGSSVPVGREYRPGSDLRPVGRERQPRPGGQQRRAPEQWRWLAAPRCQRHVPDRCRLRRHGVQGEWTRPGAGPEAVPGMVQRVVRTHRR